MARKASKKTEKKTSKRSAPKKAAQKNAVAAGIKKASRQKVAEKAMDLPAVQRELKKRWDVLNMQRLAAETQLSKVHDEIMRTPNVTGVHVGLWKRRLSKNDATETWVSPLQFCIRVHVKEKFDDQNDPRIYAMLPSAYGDIAVDVCERSYTNQASDGTPIRGQTAASAAAGAPTDNFTKPIEGGVPIAIESLKSNHWGTLGGIVFSGANIRYLTNRHVVGKAAADGVDKLKVLQPPSGVVPTGQSAVIGTVTAAAPIDIIDAALIKATGKRPRSRSIVGVHSQLFVNGVLTSGDEHHTVAFKVGAKSGFTQGIVTNTSATVIVDDKEMSNQIIVDPMNETDDLCDSGDSGSLLVVEIVQNGITINQVVGLVHAEGSTGNKTQNRSIIACHFKDVQDYFGIMI